MQKEKLGLTCEANFCILSSVVFSEHIGDPMTEKLLRLCIWPFSLLIITVVTCDEASSRSMKQMNYQVNRDNRVVKKKREAIGKLGGKDIIIGQISTGSKSSSTVPTTPIASRGSLLKSVADEMSQYPLVASDTTSGLFVTDWMPVGNLNIRQKICINVSDKNKFTVRVFRQVKDKQGDWASIDNDKNLEAQIYKSILYRTKTKS
ncbi:MAG: DUF3576 domain-containing protein [Holosporales bacterium]|nr:DUF3576 domain-containing protein [Holosporales bacterium]